jgi:periplasmic copper chaperone A
MSAFRAGLVALALFALPAQAHDGVHVEGAYARTSAQSGAVFMTIVNHGPTEDRLLSARTDAAEMAGLHTHTENADGVMQMPDVPEGFAIPGHGDHALARGGDHVMLMGLTRPLKTGDTITLILTFEREGEVTLDVPVDNDRKTPDDGGHATHSHTP